MEFFDSLSHVTTDGAWFHTNHDASIGRLLASLDAAYPARACVVAIPGFNMPNSYILDVCRQNPDRLYPIAGCNPRDFSSETEAQQRLKQWAEEGFRGVKIHPRFSRVPLDEPCVDWLMSGATEAGLPVFLCTILNGLPRAVPARPVDLIDQLLIRHPDCSTILLHGATTDVLACSDLVRLHKNTLLDLSLTIMRYENSSLDQDFRFVLERLDQRCIVGSDFPEFTPDAVKERVLSLMAGLSREKVENVMFRNLAKLIQ